MPAAHPQFGLCSGHGSYPPRPNKEGSKTVFIEGRAWHRQGDAWIDHCSLVPTSCTCHESCGPPSVLLIGSTSVFVEGQGAGRIGDPVSCGSIALDSVSTIFCGG